jgi:D-arginine dehydrogenase
MKPRVVIIGGGIAGAAAAWHLADHAEVTLVEQESHPGLHATGRSAATLSSTSGLAEVCALAEASRPFLEKPPTGFADHPLLHDRGLLWIGRNDDDRTKLDAMATLHDAGVAMSARRVDAHEASDILPALRPEAVAVGGFFEPDAKGIDVALLLQAYLSGAKAKGADVITRHEMISALRLRHKSGEWQIDIDGFTLSCDFVVNAAGAWADLVAERAGVPSRGLQPYRRTACIAAISEPVGDWPLVMDIGNRCYFEPDSGGLLVSLSDETPSEPCDAQAEEIDVALGLENVNDTITPQLRSVRRAWAGLRTFAPDRLPVVGADPANDRFLWLAGQGGAGIKIAPGLGRAICGEITGKDDDPLVEFGFSMTALSPGRFSR